MLDLDVVAQGRLVPVALVAVGDRAAEHSLDLRRLSPVVSLLFGESGDKELHAKHFFMLLHIFLYHKKKEEETKSQFILFERTLTLTTKATWHV